MERKLSRLEKKVGKKIVRTALRRVAKEVLLPASKDNALNMVGGSMGALIAKSLAVRALKRRRGSFGVRVMLKPDVEGFVDVSASGRRFYIPGIIEYGHDNAQPIPYLRNAAAAKKQQVVQMATSLIKTGIESEARK